MSSVSTTVSGLPDRKLRGALIGCGYVSQYHLAGWQQQENIELLALCDQDVARAEAAARSFPSAHIYDNAPTMFDQQRLDFVEICTRPTAHETLVNLATKHGVAILCQKPVGVDLDSMDRMIQVTSAAGVRCMVHENWRFRPWYEQMRRELDRGIIGRPVRLRVNAHDFRCLGPDGLADQPYFQSMVHFILYEMGPHLVDVARHLFGEPQSVFGALGRTGAVTGEDSAHLVLGYEDGKQAILDMCWSTSPNPDDRLPWGLQQTLVEGSEGTLGIDREGQLLVHRPDGTCRKIAVHLQEDPRVQSYAGVQQHFLECLASGAPFVTDITDNRKAMRIIYAGYESAEQGKVIALRD